MRRTACSPSSRPRASTSWHSARCRSGRARRSSCSSLPTVRSSSKAAEKAGFEVTGPQHALVITGDDRLGSIAEIHRKLYDARINVYASTGVTAECGRFGYIVYVKDQDYEAAINVLRS